MLDVDPDLARGLEPEHTAAATRLSVARVRNLQAGRWDSPGGGEEPRGHLGLLVLEGLLARVVLIEEHRACTELLGSGDVLRPWVDIYQSVPSEENWHVIERARVAMLDRRFGLAMGRWPEVSAALGDRLVERARGLAFHLAVCHLKRVDERLLIVLWHFADRWGRVGPAGVVVPLPLTHQLLASIVGAQRPSVTTALGSLKERGLAERRADGAWLLHGDAPEDLKRLRERTASVGDDISPPAGWDER